MTNRRYRNYRRALALVDALERPLTPSHAGPALRDLAEEFLLSRAASRAELGEPVASLSAVLATVVDDGQLTERVADELRRTISACGPPARPAPRRAAHGAVDRV